MARSPHRESFDPPSLEPAIGLRVGAAAGALLGVLVVVITGVTNVGVVAATAALGGFAGWWSQRRKRPA